MANSTQTKFQEYTQYLLDAFTTNTRSQDCVERGMNKVYYSIKDDHPDKDHIQTDLIYPLHDDELPNDWRYETIYDLLSAFVECEDRDQAEDRIFEIIDGCQDVYNVDLLSWARDDLQRGYTRIEDWTDTKEDPLDVYKVLQLQQWEVINTMASQLLEYIDSHKEEEE